MNNTLRIKGKGFYVGVLFAVVEMQLPNKAKHTAISPKWWHRTLRHQLTVQNVTPEEFIVMKSEFFKVSEHLSYEFF